MENTKITIDEEKGIELEFIDNGGDIINVKYYNPEINKFSKKKLTCIDTYLSKVELASILNNKYDVCIISSFDEFGKIGRRLDVKYKLNISISNNLLKITQYCHDDYINTLIHDEEIIKLTRDSLKTFHSTLMTHDEYKILKKYTAISNLNNYLKEWVLYNISCMSEEEYLKIRTQLSRFNIDRYNYGIRYNDLYKTILPILDLNLYPAFSVINDKKFVLNFSWIKKDLVKYKINTLEDLYDIDDYTASRCSLTHEDHINLYKIKLRIKQLINLRNLSK